MGQIPQQNNAAEKDPAPLLTKYFRDITGVYTKASRIGIPEDKVYNLENIIPLGPQNAHVVRNISTPLISYGADFIYWSQGINLNNVEYLVNFSSTGKVFFYNVAANTSVQINNSSSLLSGGNSRCTQWQNNIVLFIDSTGYYFYDGTNFQKISGSGVPSFGDDIAVYAGRVWIIQGRTLLNSGAGDFSAASWLPSNGAAFTVLVDPQIRSKIQRLVTVNDLLYLYATTAVNVISNVFVPTGAIPPSPIYLNTNIQSLIGTDQPGSVFTYNNYTVYTNRFGAYQLYGLSIDKLSEDIDGTWQYLDFTQAISGGQAVIEGVLCFGILLKRLNDPIFGSNTILAMYFKRADKNAWWFANFGALTFIVPTFLNNVATLYGFIGNSLYRLFSDPATAPNTQVMTKLWAMEDDLARKDVIRVGFLAGYTLFGTSLTLTEDTQTVSYPTTVTVSVAQGLWVNASGQQGNWVNAAAIQGGWIGAGPYLTNGAGVPVHDHYIGLTLTTSGYKFELNFMAIDYKLRDRWA